MPLRFTSPSSVPAETIVPAEEFSVVKPSEVPPPRKIAAVPAVAPFAVELLVSTSMSETEELSRSASVAEPWLVKLSSPSVPKLTLPVPFTVIVPSLAIVPVALLSWSASNTMPVPPVLNVTLPVAPMSMLPLSFSVDPSL